MSYWFLRCMCWHLCWNICTLHKSLLWLCPELLQPTKCCLYSRTSIIPSVFLPEKKRIASHFFLCIVLLPDIAWGRWDTCFSVKLSLWQDKHIAAVFYYCHFALTQVLQLVSDQLGVLAQSLLLCLPRSKYMRHRMKGPCFQLLAQMQQHLCYGK